MSDAPEELAEYIFTGRSLYILDRLRSLKGSRVKVEAEIAVAGRLVQHGAATLFHPSHDLVPTVDDDVLLLLALEEDAVAHPGDYQQGRF